MNIETLMEQKEYNIVGFIESPEEIKLFVSEIIPKQEEIPEYIEGKKVRILKCY